MAVNAVCCDVDPLAAVNLQVIEPIQSRCAIVRYSRLADQEILQRLLHVARTEQVQASAMCEPHCAIAAVGEH